MFVIASDGSDGVVCVGGVRGSEEDSVCGVVGLHRIQDLWSTWSCSRTDRKWSFHTKNTFVNVNCYKLFFKE